MTARELYKIYRQVEEIEATLIKDDKYFYEDAIKLCESFSDELFSLIGKLAAFEIDNEYWDKKED